MTESLAKIREKIVKELDSMATEELTYAGLQEIDLLTHTLKSIDTVMAMEESKDKPKL